VSDGLLTIDSAIHVVRTGDGQPTLQYAATKTANIRTLALDADTLAMIERLQVVREPYGPWMLGLGPKPVGPYRVGWWWKRVRELSGIDVHWRLHDVRHWSATAAIGQGHDVRTVAGRLGHSNPAMTLRVYAHAFSSADVAVAVSLGEILKRSTDV
jgi:integrase